MGDWKAPLSLKVRRGFRERLEAEAARRRLTLSAFCEALLEAGFAQFEKIGSVEKLLASVPLPTKPDFEKHVEVVDGEVKRKRGVAQRKLNRAARK